MVSATSLCSLSSVPKGRQLHSYSCLVLLLETEGSHIAVAPLASERNRHPFRKRGGDGAGLRLIPDVAQVSRKWEMLVMSGTRQTLPSPRSRHSDSIKMDNAA